MTKTTFHILLTKILKLITYQIDDSIEIEEAYVDKLWEYSLA